jgi:hypothetical protein
MWLFTHDITAICLNEMNQRAEVRCALYAGLVSATSPVMRGHCIALHLDPIRMPESIFNEMSSLCMVRFFLLVFLNHSAVNSLTMMLYWTFFN